jgi:hypothetical protein
MVNIILFIMSTFTLNILNRHVFYFRDFDVMAIGNVQMVVMKSIVKIVPVLIISSHVTMADVFQHRTNVTWTMTAAI